MGRFPSPERGYEPERCQPLRHFFRETFLYHFTRKGEQRGERSVLALCSTKR